MPYCKPYSAILLLRISSFLSMYFVQLFRLYLTLIEAQFECDAFFPNLKIFGLTCLPSEYCVKSEEALELVDVCDDDVIIDTIETENGISWKYKVLQFVQK